MLTFGLYCATFLLGANVLGSLHALVFKDDRFEHRLASLTILVLQVFAMIYLFSQIFG